MCTPCKLVPLSHTKLLSVQAPVNICWHSVCFNSHCVHVRLGCRNQTHGSWSDPDSKLYKQSTGHSRGLSLRSLALAPSFILTGWLVSSSLSPSRAVNVKHNPSRIIIHIRMRGPGAWAIARGWNWTWHLLKFEAIGENYDQWKLRGFFVTVLSQWLM